MSHHCHATQCNVPTLPEMFMCKRHWFTLPKKFRVTSKTSTLPRTTEVMFDKWTFGVEAPDATFAAAVPAGYERVQVVVGKPETTGSAPSASAPASGSPGK